MGHTDLRRALLRDELRLIDETGRLPRPERGERHGRLALAQRVSLRLHLRRAPREELQEVLG